MANQLAERGVPHGVMRLLLRMPIWLYRARLGWLLGHRFLLLTHTGRKSGQPRQVVLEVVQYDPDTRTAVVASGWGEKSNWLRNIEQAPQVSVHISSQHFAASAERLTKEAAELALVDYARRHPLAFRELGKVMIGQALKGTAEDCRRLAEVVPVIAFHPE